MDVWFVLILDSHGCYAVCCMHLTYLLQTLSAIKQQILYIMI